MTFTGPPPFAAWRHVEAADGFEVVFLAADPDGCRVTGQSCGVEDGEPWSIEYAIELDRAWVTRSARVRNRSPAGAAEVALDADGDGRWRVNGAPADALDGCMDVDLEGSAFTNAFPVHRLALAVGAASEAPAAYVRAADLRVERLEQRYQRIEDADGRRRFDYASPRFDFEAVLAYDEHGLVLDYPGIAVRAA